MEKKIADLEAWEAEKERYRLQEISAGAFAYIVKRAKQGTEPPHAICANCYEHGRKSVLQWTEASYGTLHFSCSNCGAKFDGYNGDKETFRLQAIE